MAFIFTWLRLSSTRVLDWYRRANFQPKDIAHMQKYCGERMSDKVRHGTAQHGTVRHRLYGTAWRTAYGIFVCALVHGTPHGPKPAISEPLHLLRALLQLLLLLR